jgi:hypothetical protein
MIAAVNFALAENIRGINMDFVSIGNAGNAADTTGFGAVGYNYRIGKYEITNAQWDTFTAAAGAPTGNPSYAYDEGAAWSGAQTPTTNVSWYEAAQFCNYLTSGNKSLGAYQLGTDGSITINRVAAQTTYGTIYVLPTEDEWYRYKAAFYKPNGNDYSFYANGTNTAPVAGVESNYNNAIGSPWNVGSGTMEQNGTYDMMGNAWELTETFSGSDCIIRGGSYGPGSLIGADLESYFPPSTESYLAGFRVAEIPEPATICLFAIAGLMLRRKK